MKNFILAYTKLDVIISIAVKWNHT